MTMTHSIDEIRPGTLMYACTRKPVHGRADLELVAAYEPRMLPDNPERLAHAGRLPVKHATSGPTWLEAATYLADTSRANR